MRFAPSDMLSNLNGCNNKSSVTVIVYIESVYISGASSEKLNDFCLSGFNLCSATSISRILGNNCLKELINNSNLSGYALLRKNTALGMF